MSHQTGIRANNALLDFFVKCKDGRVRLAKVCIRNEELTLDYSEQANGSWEQDFPRMLPHCLDDNQPCYVLFRLDTRSSHGYDWLLINYSPDCASIRQKMLVAATRATLKAEFGPAYICDEVQAAGKEDASLEGYKRHLTLKAAPGPLTEIEMELSGVKYEELAVQQRAKAAQSLAAQTLRGLAFPIDQEAEEKLGQLADGGVNYVQLSVDTLNEAIKLEQAEELSVHSLAECIPKNKPRYHFFRYKHTYEGDSYDTLVFMYSMPTQGCSIKERMLYSSCKGPFLDTVERFIQLTPDRKIEIDSSDRVCERFLLDQVHPQIHLNQPAFAKPRGPANRGPPRMVKASMIG